MIKRLFKIDNPMLTQLLIGDAIFLLIGELILLPFFWGKLNVFVGYFIGVLISMAMVIHMAIGIDESVRLPEKQALRHIKKTYAIRVVFMLVVFYVAVFTGIAHPVAVVCGILVLKLSAYVQPITNRLTSKLLRKGR